MRTNRPWNGFLYLKQLRWPWSNAKDQFQDDCQSWLRCMQSWMQSFCIVAPSFHLWKLFLPDFQGRGVSLWAPPCAAVAGIQNKANFPFHQFGLFNGFWAVSNRTPLLATLSQVLVAQTVKNLPAIWETWVWSLDQEDPLEKEMATHFSILAWKILWTEEPGRPQSMGLQSQTWIILHFTTGRGSMALPTPWFWTLGHQRVKDVLSHAICGTLLKQT